MLTPANYIYAYKKPRMERFLWYSCIFVSVLLLMMTSLNIYRCFGLILPQFVSSPSSRLKSILAEHIFADLLKSDPSFLCFLSVQVFQLLTNHFLLCESSVCAGYTMVRSVGQGRTWIQGLSLQFWNKTTSFEVIDCISCVMCVRCFHCTSHSLRY